MPSIAFPDIHQDDKLDLDEDKASDIPRAGLEIDTGKTNSPLEKEIKGNIYVDSDGVMTATAKRKSNQLQPLEGPSLKRQRVAAAASESLTTVITTPTWSFATIPTTITTANTTSVVDATTTSILLPNTTLDQIDNWTRPTPLDPTQPMFLMDLPYDIRRKIWLYVLPGGAFYCCSDYGFQSPHTNLPSSIKPRDKVNNRFDNEIHSNCPCHSASGKPDSRLIRVNKQTYNDTRDLILQNPITFTFGHADCLEYFSSNLSLYEHKCINFVRFLTTFHTPPYKGTAAAGKVARRTRRQFARITAQAEKWQIHARNRLHGEVKRLAGQLDRTTFPYYPTITLVKDELVKDEEAGTVRVDIAKTTKYGSKSDKMKLINLQGRAMAGKLRHTIHCAEDWERFQRILGVEEDDLEDFQPPPQKGRKEMK